MSDSNNFHNIALQSSLFKGRPDLYFCYLKSEKIAHGIARLFDIEEFADSDSLPERLLRASSYLPDSVVRYAASELEEEGLLAELFELLSLVRLSVSQSFLEERNGLILQEEYQGIVGKILLGRNASPFLSLDEFAVSPFPHAAESLPPAYIGQKDIKDKTENKRQHVTEKKDQNDRTKTILKIILDKGRVSIKDISRIIKDCSEKTIQRELAVLIEQKLVRKEGERRWSFYLPFDGSNPR